ncbi:UNVERIFIED_CONTAM: hypothetical protein HDU68_002097, partial [Siphonaria sp. JEL0065]
FSPTTCSDGNYVINDADISRNNLNQVVQGDYCGNGAPSQCGTALQFPPLPCFSTVPSVGTQLKVYWGGVETAPIITVLKTYCRCVAFSYSGAVVFSPWTVSRPYDLYNVFNVEYNDFIRGCNGGILYGAADGTNAPPQCTAAY